MNICGAINLKAQRCHSHLIVSLWSLIWFENIDAYSMWLHQPSCSQLKLFIIWLWKWIYVCMWFNMTYNLNGVFPSNYANFFRKTLTSDRSINTSDTICKVPSNNQNVECEISRKMGIMSNDKMISGFSLSLRSRYFFLLISFYCFMYRCDSWCYCHHSTFGCVKY